MTYYVVKVFIGHLIDRFLSDDPVTLVFIYEIFDHKPLSFGDVS